MMLHKLILIVIMEWTANKVCGMELQILTNEWIDFQTLFISKIESISSFTMLPIEFPGNLKYLWLMYIKLIN